jgi:hypothetical protein
MARTIPPASIAKSRAKTNTGILVTKIAPPRAPGTPRSAAEFGLVERDYFCEVGAITKGTTCSFASNAWR